MLRYFTVDFVKPFNVAYMSSACIGNSFFAWNSTAEQTQRVAQPSEKIWKVRISCASFSAGHGRQPSTPQFAGGSWWAWICSKQPPPCDSVYFSERIKVCRALFCFYFILIVIFSHIFEICKIELNPWNFLGNTEDCIRRRFRYMPKFWGWQSTFDKAWFVKF